MKQVIQSVLGWAGLELRRKLPKDVQMPVELSDAERELLKYVRKNDLTMVSNERLFATLMACKHVIDRGVEGDFVECGVWRGGNALVAAGVFKLSGSAKAVYLFDTFAGMVEPTSADVAFDGKLATTEYNAHASGGGAGWCSASLEEVRGNFKRANLLGATIHFVAGDVVETLGREELLPGKISVLRLDTDWYDSTKFELEILYPRLSIGGVLIVDDYGHWGGAKKAVDEYFEAHGNRPFLQYSDYTGRIGVKYA